MRRGRHVGEWRGESKDFDRRITKCKDHVGHEDYSNSLVHLQVQEKDQQNLRQKVGERRTCGPEGSRNS